MTIRCRLRRSKLFEKSTYQPIKLGDGITALIGKQIGQTNLKIQTLLFNNDSDKGKLWDLRMAKSWLKQHKQSLKQRIFFDDILEKAKEILLQEQVYKMPKRFSKSELMESVERLQRHFQSGFKLPKIIKKSKGEL